MHDDQVLRSAAAGAAEEISQLSGLALDCAVAQSLGFTVDARTGTLTRTVATVAGETHYMVQPYHANLAAAWQLVELARQAFFHPMLFTLEVRAGCYLASFHWCDEIDAPEQLVYSSDVAAPGAAIARAWLLAQQRAPTLYRDGKEQVP